MLPLPSDAGTALLIVDMQSFFFRTPERRVGLKSVSANINRLIAHFAARGLPVVHIRSSFKADGSDRDLKMREIGLPELIDGTAEAALLPEIDVHPQHLQLVKTRYSGFFKTDLADQLNRLQVKRVLVTRAYTHYCVNATVFDAYCHDFVPGLISDAVISHLSEEAALMIERMHHNGYHIMTTEKYLGSSGG